MFSKADLYLVSNKFLNIFKESSHNFHSKTDHIVPVDLQTMYTIFEMPPELVPLQASAIPHTLCVISLSLNLEAGVGKKKNMTQRNPNIQKGERKRSSPSSLNG